MSRGAESFYGWGASTLTGKLDLDLFQGDQQYRATATLSPPAIELTPQKVAK